MNYTAILKEITPSEIEIKGELSAEDFHKFWAQTIATMSKEVKVPGFRNGQAPENIVVNKIGEDQILLAMAENALQKLYPLIISDKKIEAIGRPEISITKLAKNNPLGFTLKTAILPIVKLPNYQKIAAEVNKKTKPEIIEVSEKEIDEFLENFKKMKSTGEKSENETKPEGKKNNPEEDTAFRDKIKEQLYTDKKRKEQEKKHLAILEAISDQTPIDIPSVLITSELDKMLQELQGQIEQAGIKFDDYLNHLKKSSDDLRSTWKPDAEKRVKIGLLLQKIITDSKLTVEPAELEDYIEKNLLPYLGKDVDRGKITDYAKNILLNQKVMMMLEKSGT